MPFFFLDKMCLRSTLVSTFLACASFSDSLLLSSGSGTGDGVFFSLAGTFTARLGRDVAFLAAVRRFGAAFFFCNPDPPRPWFRLGWRSGL